MASDPGPHERVEPEEISHQSVPIPARYAALKFKMRKHASSEEHVQTSKEPTGLFALQPL